MGAFSSGFQLGTYERVRKSTAQMRFFLSNIQGTLRQHISSFEPQCLFRLIEIFRKTFCPLSVSDVSINFVQLTALSTISLYIRVIAIGKHGRTVMQYVQLRSRNAVRVTQKHRKHKLQFRFYLNSYASEDYNIRGLTIRKLSFDMNLECDSVSLEATL